MLLAIGVDPGVSGAICVINTKTREIRFWDTPVVTVKSGKTFKKQMDLPAISALLRSFLSEAALDGLLVTIEKVMPMPSQQTEEGEERRSMGATSAFNFGVGFGMWQGLFAALSMPYELVHQASWKSKMMAGMARGKDASRVKAMQLFPQVAKDLARKKDHGRADALLLALYGVKYGNAEVERSVQPQAEPTLFG